MAVTRHAAREGALFCKVGALIKITGTTYVASWRADCCAAYPKPVLLGTVSELANDGFTVPFLPLCRNGLFRLADKFDVVENVLPWRYSCSEESGYPIG